MNQFFNLQLNDFFQAFNKSVRLNRNLYFSSKAFLPGKAISILILLLCTTIFLKAATITSRAAGGNWTNAGTWIGGVVPQATDQVIIATTTGNSVTVNNATSCSTLVVNNAATLRVVQQLTVNGTITINTSGTLTLNNNATSILKVNGDFTNSGTLTAGAASIINFTGSAAQQINGTSTSNFANLTINKTASSNTVTSATNAFAVTGNLTVTQGNLILKSTNDNYTVTGNVTVSANGTLTHSVDWDVASKLLSVGGNLTIDGAFNYTVRSHIQMTGAGPRTVKSGTSAFSILTLMTGDYSANGTLTVKDNFYPMYNSTGSFSTNGQVVTALSACLNYGGTLTINGGSLNVSGGLIIGSSAFPGNVNFTSGSLVTDGITLGEATSTVANTFTQSTGTTVTVNGAVTINQPNAALTNAWNINTGTATVNGLITFAGTNTTISRVGKIVLTTGTLNANGGITFVASAAATKVIDMAGGAGTLNLKGALTVPAASSTLTAGTTSTFNYADNLSAQTIGTFSAGGGYNNLNINTTGGTGAILSSAITATIVKGNLSVQSGTLNNGGFSIALATNKNFSVANGATFSLTGISPMVTVSGTGTRTFGASSTTSYNGAAQTVANLAYGNLVLGGTGTKTFSSGNTPIAGNLTINYGTTATLFAGSTSTSVTLTLGGVGQASGSYGGATSAASHINSTYFNSSTGILNITSGTSCTPGQWIGATSIDWNTATNWCGNAVPTATTDVIIVTGTAFQPVIGSAGAVCRNLTINSGAALTITGSNTLTVNGDWIKNGTFTPNSGTVVFSGSNAQTIGGSTSTAFYNITLNKTALANTVTNPTIAFSVNGNLTVTQGNLILQAADANYLVTGDLAIGVNGKLTHSVSWDAAGKQITLGGNLAIDGAWTYTVRSHLQMTGTGKTIRTGPSPSTLCILTLNGATISASGLVNVADNFWAPFNSTGSFSTSGYTVNANGVLLVSGGTVNVNGGSLNVTGGLQLGWNASFNNTLNLTSGTLTADHISIGDPANTLSNTLNQSGGTLQVNDWLVINQPAANSIINAFNITGGTSTVTGLITFAGTDATASRIGKIAISNATLNANGGITFVTSAAATKVIDMSGGGGTLNLKGALTVPSASSTLTAGTSSTFNYADNAAQTINFFSAGAYNNLTINNSDANGATLSAAITTTNVTGSISVGNASTGSLYKTANFNVAFNNSKTLTIAAGSIADAGTGIITFGTGGTAIINGTFRTANSTGFSGSATTAINSTNSPAITLGTASAIEYNASGNQAVTTRIYNDLVLSGSGNKTFAANTTINNLMAINGSAIALLANGTTSASNSLSFAGVTQVPGSWGGSTSAATNKNVTWFGSSTTGILNVNGCLAGTWLGIVSTDWNNAANWCGGIPLATTNVTISSGTTYQPHITIAPAVCNNLTINYGAMLTIDAGKQLTVSGSLTNSADIAGLVIKSDASGTGSLLCPNNTSNVRATVERYIANNNKWHFLSSPVTAQNIWSNFAPTPNASLSFGTSGWDWDFYYYNPNAPVSGLCWINLRMANGNYNAGVVNAANNDAGFGPITLPASPTFTPAKGYLVAYNSTSSLAHTFSGVLSDGVQSIAVIKGSSVGGTDFNLVGNPYASSIDWKATSGWSRGNLVPNSGGYDYWVYNDNYANYGVFNSSGTSGTNGAGQNIAPGQGFLVQAATTGTLSMTEAVRVHSTQAWLKNGDAENNLLRLKLTTDANTYSDEMIVEFNQAFTGGGSAKFWSFYTEAPEIYSVKDGYNYSIDRYTKLSQDMKVNISAKTGVQANYTLTASNIADFTLCNKVMLEDLKTGQLTNLSQTHSYTFTGAPGDDANRFRLIFSGNVGIDETGDNNGFTIYASENTVYIQNEKANKPYDVMVSNMLGQIISKTHLAGNSQNRIELSRVPGVYVVTVISDGEMFSKKVVIR